MKRGTAVVAALAVAAIALSSVAQAKTVFTVEEALTEIYGEGVTIAPETKELTAETLLRLEEQHRHILLTKAEKESWGCPLAEDYEEATAELEAAEYQPTTSFEFFHASKDGEKLGTAVVVDAPGKWGMVDYMVAVELEGAVAQVVLLKHSERRGKGIERKTFLTQFEGMTVDDEIVVKENITAVSGATVSSRSACAAVTKAVVLYEEFYLKEAPAKTEAPGEPVAPEPVAPAEPVAPVEDKGE